MKYTRIRNLKTIISSRWAVGIWLGVTSIIIVLIEYYTDRALIAGNYGQTYATRIQTFDIINAILFGGFVSTFAYKWIMFRDSSKKGQSGRLGGFFSLLVTGCPACSITLASYLGLASIITLLPYNGFELKVLGTLILFITLYHNLKTLTQCQIKTSVRK